MEPICGELYYSPGDLKAYKCLITNKYSKESKLKSIHCGAGNFFHLKIGDVSLDEPVAACLALGSESETVVPK